MDCIQNVGIIVEILIGNVKAFKSDLTVKNNKGNTEFQCAKNKDAKMLSILSGEKCQILRFNFESNSQSKTILRVLNNSTKMNNDLNA